MKTYARIDSGVVAELFSTDGDITQMFNPSIIWVDVTTITPQPVPGWSAVQSAGVWTFAPPPGPTLAQAQASQTAAMYVAYQTAVTQPVTYTTTGKVKQTFQADPQSQTTLMQATQGYGAAGSVPTGFYWVAADNTQVPFTLADLNGLYAAMLAQGWTAFQRLQDDKAEIRAATTSAAALAVVW